MGLAQHILRYGVVMGKALYAAAKAGIDLFKKPTISDKRRKVLDKRRKVLDKERKEYEADEKAGIKAGNKLSDADLLKKLKAQKDKGMLSIHARNAKAAFKTHQKKFAEKINVTR